MMEISEYWRRLALQLETHRTQALQLLRDVMAGTASRSMSLRVMGERSLTCFIPLGGSGAKMPMLSGRSHRN